MGDNPLAFDAVIDLCRNRHRRIVLAVLAGERRSQTLTDLTRAIVASTHHVPIAKTPEGTAAQIRASLHHVHVPKLEARSLVEYDRGRHLVAPTLQFERLEPHLSTAIDLDPDLEVPGRR